MNMNLSVEAADILRLIQSHLTECGLHDTCRALRQESGVGAAGCSSSPDFKTWAYTGQWGKILKCLATMDHARSRIPESLVADVHEMAILELAEAGELSIAYATLRVVDRELDKTESSSRKTARSENSIPRSRDLEQRLAALSSMRSKNDIAKSTLRKMLPKDFYGASLSKQERREEIGRKLLQTIPSTPPGRLKSLLQQAVKWQAHTGQLPEVRERWDLDEHKDDDENTDKKSRKRKRRKVFDIVLGEYQVDTVFVGDHDKNPADVDLDPVPSQPYSIIKFGKKATAESCAFLPDASALVTGSSDGLIEIWDSHHRFSELRMDLPYQEKEELLGHDTPVLALTVSNDGTMLASGSEDGIVKVWKIETGICLRQILAHDHSPVSCLAFSPDASHLLTGSHDGKCREFGLRTSRMLKEFHGHTSYVNTCYYSLVRNNKASSQVVLVVTGAADGTVRIWNGKTSDIIKVFRPVSLGSIDLLSVVNSSILCDHRSDLSSAISSPSIHSVIDLHTPSNAMIVAPRGLRIFLINYEGIVLRIFEDNPSSGTVFVVAAVSPSNHWLYAITESGVCCIFDLQTGKLEKSLRNFALDSTTKSKAGAKAVAEISGLVHHPQNGILAAFSNDKGQKKGQLLLWK